jgi:hypothetical protein
MQWMNHGTGVFPAGTYWLAQYTPLGTASAVVAVA